MHPVDEYEAYRVMSDSGKSVEDIAARFGTTETMVRKRLALGRVSPELLDLYRNEEMSFQQLTAFTVSDDHERQVEVWKSLPHHNRDGETIRDVLQGKAVKFNDKRIKFIGGIEAYEAAGGPVKRDLFDTRNSGFALDAALSKSLLPTGWKSRRKHFAPRDGNGWRSFRPFRRKPTICTGSIRPTSR